MPKKAAPLDGKRVPPPLILVPTAVYTIDQARAAFGLARSTLSREVRLGRLRVSVRAGKRFFMGLWLAEWIERGEVRKPHPAPPNGQAGRGAKDCPETRRETVRGE
jgi:hypothetical protein